MFALWLCPLSLSLARLAILQSHDRQRLYNATFRPVRIHGHSGAFVSDSGFMKWYLILQDVRVPPSRPKHESAHNPDVLIRSRLPRVFSCVIVLTITSHPITIPKSFLLVLMDLVLLMPSHSTTPSIFPRLSAKFRVGLLWKKRPPGGLPMSKHQDGVTSWILLERTLKHTPC